ncbi:MAG: hypothetical protein BGN85_10090 [Alphaproteobacteria bacterium 64-11]|nr:hypothetical protein [Alphaproteobacteria bacterium]OJU13092.1 MAG: hypothetical protein BGN85_10090 [Alphaproteobacteria bacterium 64-11]
MFATTISPAGEEGRTGWRASPELAFGLFAGLAAFALAALSPAILNDSDTYWQILSGAWMVDHSRVLRADPFSYTAAGQALSTQSWLAEIVMAQVYRAAGWAGIHALFGAAAGLTAFTVARFLRRRIDTLPALVTAVLGLACVSVSLLARPHMLALPLLALWTAALVAAREKNAAPSYWLLPVMALWANLHGSFAFGLALAAALGAEAIIESPTSRRTAIAWGAFLLAAVAAAMLTPEGWRGLLFPVHLTAMTQLAHIGEWQASDFTHPGPLEFALLGALFVLARGRVRVRLVRLLILMGLVHLALAHARHQMLLGVAGTLLLAPALAAAWPARNRKTSPLPAVAAGLLLVLGLALRLSVPAPRGQDAISPQAALAHVPRFVREMPVLNDYAFGGYLIWTGARPFVDSRADLYGDDFLSNYAALTAPDKDALASSLAYYHVRWTIFRADAPVVKLLDAMPGWQRLYADNVAVVHVHD